MKSCILVACLILATCSAEQDPTASGTSTGKCDRKVVENFNLTAYMGEWFEIWKFGRTPFEDMGSCAKANYTLKSDGNVTVVNSMLNETAQAYQNITGVAKPAVAGSTDGKLSVNFPGQSMFQPYWVLSTDYKNYSIVLFCNETSGNETSWILTRSTMLSNMTTQKVKDELKKFNLTLDRYSKTQQDEKVCKVSGSAATASVAAVALLAAALLGRLL